MNNADPANYEFLEILEEVIDSGVLGDGTPAHGIALQVFHQGMDSLSDLQRGVFRDRVRPALKKLAISRERRENIERVNNDR